MSGIRGTYANGFAPRDGRPLYPGLWRGVVGAWNPGLGPTGLSLRDWSGYGNHGTLISMLADSDWVASGGRWSLDFDGSNDYVNLGQSTGLCPPQMSVSVWVYMSSLSAAYSAIYSRVGNPITEYVQLLVKSSGKLAIYVYAGGSVAYDGTGAFTLSVNRWYHLAFSYSVGSGLVGYVDGVRDGSASGTSPLSSFVSTSSLGTDLNTAGRYLNGRLDDCNVYNRPVAQSEFAILAQRRGIAYEMAPLRRYNVQGAAPTTNRRRRILLGNR